MPGHLSNLEEPAAYNTALRSFLEQPARKAVLTQPGSRRGLRSAFVHLKA